jgi:polysaccharide export outer membrane protein
MEKPNCGASAGIARRAQQARVCVWLMLCAALVSMSGCYAPLVSGGIHASTLPDEFRTPWRTGGPQLNLASLTIPAQPEYLLGPDDLVEVVVYGLTPDAPPYPLQIRIMGNGQIHLPIIGGVNVGGMNLLQAQEAIIKAYADDVIKDPRISITLVEKATVSVLVLGEVNAPGVYRLPKNENDVAHAIAMAGGLTVNAELEIEVHRRIDQTVERLPLPRTESSPELLPLPPAIETRFDVVRIPLRGFSMENWTHADVVLNQGSVVKVPSRRDEVFFVVGKLSLNNAVRFSLGREERELGGGFVLPRDRDIDVVTAVAMAGYIDPIDSPTTVTVHRVKPDGEPMLIRVNLIKARHDRLETVLVQAGDIIYLNPDPLWWTRRTFDRVVPDIITLSYRKLLGLGGGN